MTVQPLPREGLPGIWDSIVGPEARPWENAGTVGFAALGAIAAPLLLRRERPQAGVVEQGVAVAIGTDIAGGAWANETPAAKRWYHHQGTSRLGRIAFAAGHVYPFVVEATSRRFQFKSAALTYGTLVAGAALLEAVPTKRRRSTAMALYTAWLAGNTILAPPPTGYAWLPPVLGYKILVGHGTPSSPLSRLGSRGR